MGADPTARIRDSARAFDERRWRVDLRQWDEVDRPGAIEQHQALQAVDVATLSDPELARHIARCRDHLTAMHRLHHRYTVASTIATGDLLAAAQDWTSAAPGEVLGLPRGRSSISRGFAAHELDAAAKAIIVSAHARDVLGAPRPAPVILAELAADPTCSGCPTGRTRRSSCPAWP